MAFTFVSRTLANSSAEASGSATSITKVITGVTAGSLIVLMGKGENAASTLTASDGTSSFTGGTQENHVNGDLRSRLLYLPISVASGSVTYAINFSVANTFRSLIMMEFTHDGTGAFDTQLTGQSGGSAAVSSGSMSSSADTNHLMIGGYGEYSSGSLSSALCAGAAADALFQLSTTNFTGMWRKTFTSGAVTGAASATIPSSAWTANGMIFKETGGGAAFIARRGTPQLQAVKRASFY